MNDPGVEASFAQCPLDGSVVHAGHFHGCDRGNDSFGLAGILNLQRHGFQARAVVLDGRWLNNGSAVVLAEEPLGSFFSTVDCDDSEVFRSRLLDAFLNNSAGHTDVSSFGFGSCRFFCFLRADRRS